MKLRGLYAITDSQLLAGRFLSHVEAALEGGVCLLQYRDKSDDAARRLREAEGLMKLCERYGTQLLINDDAELAARLGVGVHLGQTDGPLTPARALLGRNAIIGSTCHAQLDLARQAASDGTLWLLSSSQALDNLRAALAGEAPRRTYRPRWNNLYLMNTGDGSAIASYGPLAAEGHCVLALKHWIDKRWIAQYARIAQMA